jgi:TolB-like protein
MKRCPECRRDYFDDSLLYCLEDGAALIQGSVPSPDEPVTAILSSEDLSYEAPTRAQVNTTDGSTVFPTASDDLPARTVSRKNSLIAGIVGIVLVTTLGIGSYLYYGRSASNQIESVAVMPFFNDSGNADVEYLSDGMTETLISSLTRLPNLNVKSRSTVFRYKGKDTNLKTIGKELDVQSILTGHVTQRGDQLILSLELVDAATENAIWSQQYSRKQSDLVALQSEIAKDVSIKLKAKLSGAEESKVTQLATSDPEAYQDYLKGRFFWNQRGQGPGRLAAAIEQFKAAVSKDPNYGLAYAGLADCYVLMPRKPECRLVRRCRRQRPMQIARWRSMNQCRRPTPLWD